MMEHETYGNPWMFLSILSPYMYQTTFSGHGPMGGPSASTPSQPRWRQGRSPWRIKTHGALELCHQRSPEQVPNKHVGISLIILKNCRFLHHFNCCFWFDHGKTSAETSPRFERDPLQGFTHDFSGSESWLKTEAAGKWICQEQNC